MAGILALLGALLLPGAVTPAGASESTVVIRDNVFQPTAITIAAGSSVVWVNQGADVHTVTSNEGGFDSGVLRPNAQWAHVFREPGRYAYHCTFHGDMGMTGTVIVLAEGAVVPVTEAPTTTAVPPTTAAPAKAPAPVPTTPTTAVAPTSTTVAPTTTSTALVAERAASNGGGGPKSSAPAGDDGSHVGMALSLATLVLLAAALVSVTLRKREDAKLY